MEETLKEAVYTALRTVKDPEIPVDVVELGLIYEVSEPAPGEVSIRMTLTAPNCPVAGDIVAECQQKVAAVDGVTKATVDLVFDPPWDKSKMSEAASLFLGFEV